MGMFGDEFDRIDRSQRVGDMSHRHQFRAGTEQGREGVQDQLAGVVDRHDTKYGSGLLREDLPGHDVRVVFHRGE